MKIAIISALLLAFSASVTAQTAKVIQLSPEDAAKAKSLYAQKADIEKKIADLQDQIAGGYTTEKKEETVVNCCCCGIMGADGKTYVTQFKQGWESGFEYSSDFKFIVPKLLVSTPYYNGCLNYATTANTLTCGILSNGADLSFPQNSHQ